MTMQLRGKYLVGPKDDVFAVYFKDAVASKPEDIMCRCKSKEKADLIAYCLNFVGNQCSEAVAWMDGYNTYSNNDHRL